MRRLIGALLTALTLSSMPAHAVGERGVGHGQGDRELVAYKVANDGSYTQTVHSVRVLSDHLSLHSDGTTALSYNRTLQRLDIDQAYTLKADGRRVEVPATQIKDVPEPLSNGAAMFQDERIRVLEFPDLALNDTVVLQYTVHQLTPTFPGHFSGGYNTGGNSGRRLTVIVDMPQERALYTDVSGFIASKPMAPPGRAIYQYDFETAESPRIEVGAISDPEQTPRLVLSTFPDMAAFARAYNARAQDKLAQTPRVRKLAREVTRGLHGARAKAYALDDWVRKNIRYVAMYIGAGGFVPHSADAVLDNLFGDCKDHATLLQAMLGSVGIDSTGVLIDYGSSYDLPSVGAPVFNHQISFIPSLNLYLDSTAAHIAPGFLPPEQLDKPTLLIGSGTIGRTPATQPASFRGVLDYQLGADGSATFQLRAHSGGLQAELLRTQLRDITPADRAHAIERTLAKQSLHGSGTITLGEDGAAQAVLLGVGQVDDLVNLPGPVGVAGLTSLGRDLEMKVQSLLAERVRTRSFVCLDGDTDETAHIVLPAGVDILYLPPALTLHNAFFDYRSQYRREGATLTIMRSLSLHHGHPVCSAAEFTRMLPELNKAMADIKSQIIMQGQ
ncbi:MAG: DUF3857 and transglutaminase domain-containing protein [Pseudomonadota bacterium]